MLRVAAIAASGLVVANAQTSPSPLTSTSPQVDVTFDVTTGACLGDADDCAWTKITQVCRLGSGSNATDISKRDALKGGFLTAIWPGRILDSRNMSHMTPTDSASICSSYECRTLVHDWTNSSVRSPKYAALQDALAETMTTVCRFREGADGYWKRLAATKFARITYTASNVADLSIQGRRIEMQRTFDLALATAFSSHVNNFRTLFWYQKATREVEVEVMAQCFDTCLQPGPQPGTFVPRAGLKGCILCSGATVLAQTFPQNFSALTILKADNGLAAVSLVYGGLSLRQGPALDDGSNVSSVFQLSTYTQMTTYGADLATASWAGPLRLGLILSLIYVVLGFVIAATPLAPAFAKDGPAAARNSRVFATLVLIVEIGTLTLSVYAFTRFCENWIVYGNWFFAVVAGVALFLCGGIFIERYVIYPPNATTCDHVKVALLCLFQLYPFVTLAHHLMSGNGSTAVASAIGNRGAFLCPILSFLCLYSVLLSATPPLLPFFGIETAFPTFSSAEITFRFAGAGFLVFSAGMAALTFARGPSFVKLSGFCFVYWVAEIVMNVGGFAVLGFLSIPEDASRVRHCAIVITVVLAVQFVFVWAAYRQSLVGHLEPGRENFAALKHVPRVLIMNTNRFDQSDSTRGFNRAVIFARLSTFVVIFVLYFVRQPLPEPIARHIIDNDCVKGLLGSIGTVALVYLVLDVCVSCILDKRKQQIPDTDTEASDEASQSDSDSD